MKFLILATCLFGAALAQQGQQRRQPNNNNNNYQQQNTNDDQYQDQNQQQPQQQPFQAPKQQQQAPAQNSYQPDNKRETTTYIPIIRFDKSQGNDGSYKASWETGNNIQAEEEGYLKSLGPNPDPESKGEELNAQVQQGSYSYTSPEGQVISVHYTADETGFHPTGDHLPTPPPVSPEVQKGLDLIYAGIKEQAENAAREASNPSLRRENQQQDYNGNNGNNNNNNNNNNQNNNQYRQ